MIPASGAPQTANRAPPSPLDRRFEAIIFDWDGTAGPDHVADAGRLRRLIEESCAAGIEVAIVSGATLDAVDGQLRARPAGPGRLMLALHDHSEAFRINQAGPQLMQRRAITAAVDGGLAAAEVDGTDAAVMEIARAAPADAGDCDPRVTSTSKHIEIGLADKSDSLRWVMRELWLNGIGPSQILVSGEELGPLGTRDANDVELVNAPHGVTAVSIEGQPVVTPAGIVKLGGGSAALTAVLEDQIARRHSGELPVAHADPAWTLTIDDAAPPDGRERESLLTLADGRLGTRGSMLVSNQASYPSVLLSGVYTGAGPETQLLAGPGWNSIEIVDHADLSTRRVLDLHTGTLTHELAGDAHLQALALSSLARPATTVMRVRARGVVLKLPHGLRLPAGVEHERGVSDGREWMRVLGSPGSIVAASHVRVSEDRPGDWSLDRVSCYEGVPAGVADERLALGRLDDARERGFEGLLSEHRRSWAARWEDADIRIDGDPDLQLSVRLALFHLMASVADEGEAAVGARGLTGGAYHGHIFWDSDVYVLPFLAATHPPAARAMLEYRVRRLPAALAAARAEGRTGARFPWESADSGDDMTPVSVPNAHGGIDAIYTGQQEEHITADIAWAAAHYIDWTGDRAFAAGPGLELLVQTARWWASRIELDADGSAHIRGVMGPDEYHESIDDDAYTNVMARWNLRRAANSDPRGALEPTERHHWLALADAIVDGYDPGTGIYEQFAGFYRLEPLLIAELTPQRPVAADMLLGHERTRGAQIVKQPDVLMLHYLLTDEVAAGSLEPNLAYYGPRTAHGSTLSPGVHAALLARSGQLEQAVELLRLTARIDLDDIGGVTGGGLHLAAMGSVWRTLSLGFAGLRPVGDALAIDPVIARGWETLELRVRFRGSRVRVRIRSGAAEASAEPPVFALSPAGERVQLGRTAQTFELSQRPAGRSR
jgi:trehalose/maltose hydrolase-like predicted phosphorylase